MKDLYKPGRPINEYLKTDGTLKVECFTCIHRWSIHLNEGILGGFLCQDGIKKHSICNPRYGIKVDDKSIFVYDYLLWEPRVDANTFIDEKEFEVE
jgi:hypothetical protein